MVEKVAQPNQVIGLVMQEARRRGLDWFQPHHAAGMVGSFMQETGNFRKDVLDMSVRGDQGTAHGLMQWRGVRWDNLQAFAQERGMELSSLSTQISFAFEEADPSSRYKDYGSIKAFEGFRTASNAQEAALEFVRAERSAGFDGSDPTTAHDASRRVSHANSAYSSFTGEEDLSNLGGSSYDGSASGTGGGNTREDFFRQALRDRNFNSEFALPTFKAPGEQMFGAQTNEAPVPEMTQQPQTTNSELSFGLPTNPLATPEGDTNQISFGLAENNTNNTLTNQNNFGTSSNLSFGNL